jgi:hypothetical protein
MAGSSELWLGLTWQGRTWKQKVLGDLFCLAALRAATWTLFSAKLGSWEAEGEC